MSLDTDDTKTIDRTLFVDTASDLVRAWLISIVQFATHFIPVSPACPRVPFVLLLAKKFALDRKWGIGRFVSFEACGRLAVNFRSSRDMPGVEEASCDAPLLSS